MRQQEFFEPPPEVTATTSFIRAVLLAVGHEVDSLSIQGWTPAERLLAYDYAIRVRLHADAAAGNRWPAQIRGLQTSSRSDSRWLARLSARARSTQRAPSLRPCQPARGSTARGQCVTSPRRLPSLIRVDDVKRDFDRRLATLSEGFCPYCSQSLERVPLPRNLYTLPMQWGGGSIGETEQLEDQVEGGRCSCCGATFATVSDPEWGPGWLCLGGADCEHLAALLRGEDPRQEVPSK